MKKFLISLGVLALFIGFHFTLDKADAISCLPGQQGGTGQCTGLSGGTVGQNLYVSSINASGSPTYGFQANGSGGSSGGLSTSSPFTSGGIVTVVNGNTVTASSSVNASSVTASLYDTGGFGFHVKAYGAKCDGVTDDSAAYQSAANLVATNGGAVLACAGSEIINTCITISSNTTVIAPSYGATTLKKTSAATSNCIFQSSGANNVTYQNFNFNNASGSYAIVSYGGDALHIFNNIFTGTSTYGTQGAITLNGQNAIAPFTNTKIEGNYFHDMPNGIRPVYIYARNTGTIDSTLISDNIFASTAGPAIFLDNFTSLTRTTVTNNIFKNIYGVSGPTGSGVGLYGGITSSGTLSNTIFSNNQYYNSITTSTNPLQTQGLVYIYDASGTIISNNIAYGSWGPVARTAGPAIAPGRVDTPDYNLQIFGNYIQGFDAPTDPDSQVNSDIHNNTVVYSGGCFNIGYGTQINIKIHDNLCYDSGPDQAGSISTPYAMVAFDNSDPVNSSWYNNTIVFDSTSTTWTGQYPTSTILLTGNHNYSDVSVYNNQFYLPNSNLSTTSTIFTKQSGSEILPTTVYGNRVHELDGIYSDIGGIYPQLAIANRFTATNTFAGNVSTTFVSAPCIGTNAVGVWISGTCISTSTFNSTGTNTFFPFWSSNTLTATSSLAQLTGGGLNVSSSLVVSSTINGFFISIGTAGVASNFGITTAPWVAAGDNNLAIGQGALANSGFTGARNVAIGSQALNAVTSANFNTAVGSLALNKETAASNVGVGYNAMSANVSGDNATAIGAGSLDQATSYGNTALGSLAGHSLTGGNSNLFLGRDAGNNASQGTGINNSTALGQGSYTTQSNQQVFGSSAVNNYFFNCGVNIGTSTNIGCLNIQGSSTQSGPANFSSTITTNSIAANSLVGISATGTLIATGTPTVLSGATLAGITTFTGSSTLVTPSIGGAITGGGCDSATSSIDASYTSSTTGFITTPQNDPGTSLGGAFFYSFITAPGVLTTRVCAGVTVTPNTTPYVVKIFK